MTQPGRQKAAGLCRLIHGFSEKWLYYGNIKSIQLILILRRVDNSWYCQELCAKKYAGPV